MTPLCASSELIRGFCPRSALENPYAVSDYINYQRYREVKTVAGPYTRWDLFFAVTPLDQKNRREQDAAVFLCFSFHTEGLSCTETIFQ